AHFNDARTIRALRELGAWLKKNSHNTVLLLSPTLVLPTELEKEITVLDVPLPGYDELVSLLKGIVDVVRKTGVAQVDLSRENADLLVKAATGLTLCEAENAYAEAIGADGKLSGDDVARVQEEKKQVIRKSGLLEFFPTDETLANV